MSDPQEMKFLVIDENGQKYLVDRLSEDERMLVFDGAIEVVDLETKEEMDRDGRWIPIPVMQEEYKKDENHAQ